MKKKNHKISRNTKRKKNKYISFVLITIHPAQKDQNKQIYRAKKNKEQNRGYNLVNNIIKDH